MVKEINILKLVKGLDLTNEELKLLYTELYSEVCDISLKENNTHFYFSNDADIKHYLMLTILHRLKTPIVDYQKHFNFLNLSNPYNYHYNVWASLCLAERDTSDFNIDYSLILKKMFNVASQSYMHSVEESQRDSLINRSEYEVELHGLEWGNPSFGDWDDIESIDHSDDLSWSAGYVNFSLDEFLKYRFNHDRLPDEIHYALLGEINWKECSSIITILEEIGIKLNTEKQMIIKDELMQRNYADLSSLMTAFLILFESKDYLNLEKLVLALSKNFPFSEKYSNLNNIFNSIKLIKEKMLCIDFLDIYKLIYENSRNIKELNDLFNVKELGKLLLSGLLSLDSKTNSSIFKLANGKSFVYSWTLNSYDKNEFEHDCTELPF